MRINVRKLPESWSYDFKMPGMPRQRKAGFRTRADALAAGTARYAALTRGCEVQRVTLKEMYEQYLAAKTLANRSRDALATSWKLVKAALGDCFIDVIDTAMLDRFKQSLPAHFSPASINHHMGLISTVLRFAHSRGKLQAVPYVPKVKNPKKAVLWYNEQERDQLLAGMFKLRPRWYAFFYVTMRLGLRVGEVYALTRRQVRDVPPQLIIDQAAERGRSDRPAQLKPRKNNDVLVLNVPPDVMEVIRWHIAQGYAGRRFLFCERGLPRYLESHKRPLRAVQRACGLRELSHHKVGRHSVGGQAMTAGLSLRALQAQLGHLSPQSTARYANIGSEAQLRLVESLTPTQALPHLRAGE